MTFLVDANVLSEPTRALPDRQCLAWLAANEAEMAVDPIVLGEIRFGILLLPNGKRRREPLMATPAASDGIIVIRGQRHIFAVR